MQTTFVDDLDVLNYALTLEHLASALYKQVADLEFGDDAYGNSMDDYLAAVGKQEDEHVQILQDLIAAKGGSPVAPLAYDFAVEDITGFVNVAADIENLKVAAYDGLVAAIADTKLLASIAGIVGVEGRHAAYLNLASGFGPFPDSVETPLGPDDVAAGILPYLAGQ